MRNECVGGGVTRVSVWTDGQRKVHSHKEIQESVDKGKFVKLFCLLSSTTKQQRIQNMDQFHTAFVLFS
jgi:hypothetical protein